jgi:hypothetical protein
MNSSEIKTLFLGGIELDLQTAYKRISRADKKIDISDLECELDRYVSNGILSIKFSLKDPYEYSELKSFESEKLMNTFKKSKNPLENKITGARYSFDECTLVKYYRLINPEYVYPGLNPIEKSSNIPCVIFGCDAISFSQRDSKDQVQLYKTLIDILSECLNDLEIRPDDVISIPTGDGYFVIFHSVGDPIIAIKYAHAIQELISARSLSLPLRIGIELGTVFEIIHKNKQINAIGHSLNSCARIMSFGNEKHILVSKTFYDACVSHSDQKNNFTYVGEKKDKHGYKYEIYNYLKDAVGNSEAIAD